MTEPQTQPNPATVEESASGADSCCCDSPERRRIAVLLEELEAAAQGSGEEVLASALLGVDVLWDLGVPEVAEAVVAAAVDRTFEMVDQLLTPQQVPEFASVFAEQRLRGAAGTLAQVVEKLLTVVGPRGEVTDVLAFFDVVDSAEKALARAGRPFHRSAGPDRRDGLKGE